MAASHVGLDIIGGNMTYLSDMAKLVILIAACFTFVPGCGGGGGSAVAGDGASSPTNGPNSADTGNGDTIDDNANANRVVLPQWFANGIVGKTICMVGDSTTSHATALFDELNKFYKMEGEALYGVGAILNYGQNGASLTAFLSDRVAYGISASTAAQADLYVISYGINDVRQGVTGEDQLVELLSQAVERIRSGVPHADIVLRMPNSLLSEDVSGLGYVRPNENAQLYSTILRNAYLRLLHRWENVEILDTQTLVFGAESRASSVYMSDQIHPSNVGYVALAEALVDVIGYERPFDARLAENAFALNPAEPYSIYPRAVEDPTHYDMVATGRWVSSSAAGSANGYIQFAWPASRSGELRCGDIVQMAQNYVFEIPPGCVVTPVGGYTRIDNLGGASPPITMTGGTINIWREK